MTFISDKVYIAREDINKGDVIVIIWKRFCRRAKMTDLKIVVFAGNRAKKGEKLSIMIPPIERDK